MRLKHGSLATLLSLLQPGLGQLYNRQIRKAFLCLVFLPCLIAVVGLVGIAHTFRGLVLFAVISLLFQIGVAVEAGVVGVRSDEASRHEVSRWVVVLFLVLAAANATAILGNFYTRWLLSLHAFVMRSNSMSPTLLDDDRIVADMNAYSGTAPTRGDVIIFSVPGMKDTLYTKRIAAIGGETIAVNQNGIVVDGSVITSSPVVAKAAEGEANAFGLVTVPVSSVFVLGDAINDSYDSRYFGSVPVKAVRGKVLFVYWSKDHSRIGENVH